MEQWKEDAEKAWKCLSWQGEAQWFGTKEIAGRARMAGPTGGWSEAPPELRKRTMGGRLHSLDALIGTIRNAEALGWNLYLGLNPGRRAGAVKLNRQDITHWRYVLVDLDPNPGLVPPDIMAALAASLLIYAHRLFTGSGYHYWLPLPKALEIGHLASSCTAWYEPVNPGTVELTMAGFLQELRKYGDVWAPGWIIDTHCSDLPRVVRCPGSVNQKTGKRATFERVYGGCPFDISELMRYTLPTPTPPAVVVGPTANLLDVIPHLNVRARTFILEGAEKGQRHNACYATCKNLHELGVSRERALEWLLIGAGQCHENWMGLPADIFMKPLFSQKALDLKEVEKIVNQVYGA